MDVAVTNPNPPPLESRPHILFSGFINPIAEQKVRRSIDQTIYNGRGKGLGVITFTNFCRW